MIFVVSLLDFAILDRKGTSNKVTKKLKCCNSFYKNYHSKKRIAPVYLNNDNYSKIYTTIIRPSRVQNILFLYNTYFYICIYKALKRTMSWGHTAHNAINEKRNLCFNNLFSFSLIQFFSEDRG